MANAAYVNWKNLVLGNGTHTLPDFDTDTIKAYLCDSADYTANLSTDQDLEDIPSGARVANATISNPSVSGGVFDADDTTLSAVSGDQSELIVILKDSGSASTSTLAFYFDTFSSGMPVVPNGGDILIVWNASGIVAL